MTETDILYEDYKRRMRKQRRETLFQNGELVDPEIKIQLIIDKSGLNAYMGLKINELDDEKIK